MSAVLDAPTYGEMRTEEEQAFDRAVVARVRRGIKLLQEKHGDNWVEKINMRTLHISNGSCCILGQMYESYEDGCEKLWGAGSSRSNEAISHGFLIPDWSIWEENRGLQWKTLQETWERELHELIQA